MIIERIFSPNITNSESFFLWGPRKTGKTSWLKHFFPKCLFIDFLKSDVFFEFQSNPSKLREIAKAQTPGSRIIIDEIQKIPIILDEVHWIIENLPISFGLCGSSARKLKRGHANLLGGRAIRFEMLGLCFQELRVNFSLNKILNSGCIPAHYLLANPWRYLKSYVGDYLKEEIMSEGLVRNLPAFSRFLEVAAFSDGNQINYSSIARDCHVSSNTVRSYFEILEDTLIGVTLLPYRKQLKRRVVTSAKFYYFDVGVVNYLAKRKDILPGSMAFGLAFENYIFHELRCYNLYKEKDAQISFWRTDTDLEVDFIINDLEIAIDVKSSSSIHSDHLKGLSELQKEINKPIKKIMVCLEQWKRITEDDIMIMPVIIFLEELWGGALF